jgi:hypothetical protein
MRYAGDCVEAYWIIVFVFSDFCSCIYNLRIHEKSSLQTIAFTSDGRFLFLAPYSILVTYKPFGGIYYVKPEDGGSMFL